MDKRESKRVSLDRDVVINRKFRAEGLDLSEDGMYIYTRNCFVAGEILEVDFDLDGETLRLMAKVQHSQPGVGIGVGFIDLPEDLRKKIDKALRACE